MNEDTHMILVFRGLLRNPAQRTQSSARAYVATAYQTWLSEFILLHTQSTDEKPEAAWFCLPEATLNNRLEPGSVARSSIFLLYHALSCSRLAASSLQISKSRARSFSPFRGRGTLGPKHWRHLGTKKIIKNCKLESV